MKYYGKIGYAETVKTAPGVWQEQIVERDYFGDVTRNLRRLEGQDVNEDLNVSNSISIVSDPYAVKNFHSIRYVTYMDTKWKVTSVEVQYPRLLLTIGGVYNEEDA